jgi:superfamily II DNA or RNA helicase
LQDYREFRDYQSELKYLVTDQSRLEFLAKFIESLRDTGNTLVLVDRIACGEELAKLIPNSSFISGGTKGTDRKAEYADIHVSDDKILISTFGLTSTGVNIPRVFNLVLLEPGKSFVRVIQSIGRGVRKAHDKDFVNIYDVTSSCKFSKRHLAKRKTYYSESQYPYSQDKVEWK